MLLIKMCQACLNVMPSRSLSYAKIVQGESRDTSLLVISAEPQPILCKVTQTLLSVFPFASAFTYDEVNKIMQFMHKLDGYRKK